MYLKSSFSECFKCKKFMDSQCDLEDCEFKIKLKEYLVGDLNLSDTKDIYRIYSSIRANGLYIIKEILASSTVVFSKSRGPASPPLEWEFSFKGIEKLGIELVISVIDNAIYEQFRNSIEDLD